jgi:hypothetical protein
MPSLELPITQPEDGKIISECMLWKYDAKVKTELIWMRIRTCGGLF